MNEPICRHCGKTRGEHYESGACGYPQRTIFEPVESRSEPRIGCDHSISRAEGLPRCLTCEAPIEPVESKPCRHCGKPESSYRHPKAASIYHDFEPVETKPEAEQGLPNWDGEQRVREFSAFGATAEERKTMELRMQLYETKQERDAANARARIANEALLEGIATVAGLEARVTELEASEFGDCDRCVTVYEFIASKAVQASRCTTSRRGRECDDPQCPEHGVDRPLDGEK